MLCALSRWLPRGLRSFLVPALLAPLCLGAACSQKERPPAPNPALGSGVVTPPPAPPPKQPHAPMTQAELGTTDGAIAVGNLSAAIEGAEVALRSNPNTPGVYGRLIMLLITRGQYAGRIADYERAAELAQKTIKLAPNEAVGYQARAAIRSIFHEFTGAFADLEQAEKLGANPAGNRDRRASLLHATGKTDEAYKLLTDVPGALRDIGTAATIAATIGARGDVETAERLFIGAQEKLADTSPFPLAWLYVQHGLMWENAGRSARARELYAAAVERVPGYAIATSHLAAMEAVSGDREAAIARLRKLVTTSDDPEYQGQLAGLLKEQAREKDGGASAEAEELTAAAARRYAELLARHPAAFAGHAARFYLGAGGDAKTALTWAEKARLAGRTEEAELLATEAALAAGASARACELADSLSTAKDASPRAKVMASRAYTQCGKKDAADALLRSLAAK